MTTNYSPCGICGACHSAAPNQFRLTVTGIENDPGCNECDNFNGTYVLEINPDPPIEGHCQWNYDGDVFCGMTNVYSLDVRASAAGTPEMKAQHYVSADTEYKSIKSCMDEGIDLGALAKNFNPECNYSGSHVKADPIAPDSETDPKDYPCLPPVAEGQAPGTGSSCPVPYPVIEEPAPADQPCGCGCSSSPPPAMPGLDPEVCLPGSCGCDEEKSGCGCESSSPGSNGSPEDNRPGTGVPSNYVKRLAAAGPATVNFSSGNLVFPLPGLAGGQFAPSPNLTHNSFSVKNSDFGRGWSSLYNQSIEELSDDSVKCNRSHPVQQ